MIQFRRHTTIPAGIMDMRVRAPASAAGNGLLNNLVAYWPLNEAAGANDALDAHSNGLTLTQVSSPGAGTGKVYATARTFDGSANYFERNNETLLQMSIDFTIAAWIYRNATASRYVFGKGDVDYELLWESENLIWRYYAASAYRSVSIAFTKLNEWHFVLCTYTATANTMGISLDGGAETAQSFANAPVASTGIFRVGARGVGTASRWPGRIGPVAMWKSTAGGGGVLTAAQRTALWNGGAGLPYASFTV